MSHHVLKRVIGRHACERCRKAKVKCFTDALETVGKCRKCHAGGMECQWKEISKTRVRTRTNARVDDLERQLTSLTAAMDDIQNKTRPDSTSHDEQFDTEISPSFNHNYTLATIGDDVSSLSVSYTPNSYGPHLQHGPPGWSAEYHQFNTFPAETKSQLINIFASKLLPQYPVLFIPSEPLLEELEASTPFTTNAIITAACSISEPGSFKAMHDKSIAMLSQTVLLEGRKSMDLLQALLVTAIWACPPDDLDNLNIYQWSHIACTMALELGLGGKTSLQAQAQHVNEFSADPSKATMQRYRTMFGVYLTCSRLVTSTWMKKVFLTRS